MKANDKPTAFLNVQVTAIPKTDVSTGKTKYITSFDPEELIVREFDSVINYQLVSPTPTGVTFKSVTVKPGREDQLSDPTISESGKLLTFSDANTKKATFSLTLHFKDDQGTEFKVDPEVKNDPDPDYLAQPTLMPEVPNDPPDAA